jgi:hypothetical protein
MEFVNFVFNYFSPSFFLKLKNERSSRTKLCQKVKEIKKFAFADCNDFEKDSLSYFLGPASFKAKNGPIISESLIIF